MRCTHIGFTTAAVLALVTGAAFTGSGLKLGSRDTSATPDHTSLSAHAAAEGHHGSSTTKVPIKDPRSNIGPHDSPAPGHTSPSAPGTHGSSSAKVIIKDPIPNSKLHDSSAPGRTGSSAHQAAGHGLSTSKVPPKNLSLSQTRRLHRCVRRAGKHGSPRPKIRPKPGGTRGAHGAACCACGKMPRHCASRGRASPSAKKAGTSVQKQGISSISAHKAGISPQKTVVSPPKAGNHVSSTRQVRLRARQEDFEEEEMEEEPLTVGQKIDLCIWNVKEFGYKVQDAPYRFRDFIKYSCCSCCFGEAPWEEDYYVPPVNHIMPHEVELNAMFPDGYDIDQLRTYLHQYYPMGDHPVMTDHPGQNYQFEMRNYPEAPHVLPWEYPVSLLSPEHQEFHGDSGAEFHPFPPDYKSMWGWASQDPYASPKNPMPERQPAFVPGEPVGKRDLSSASTHLERATSTSLSISKRSLGLHQPNGRSSPPASPGIHHARRDIQSPSPEARGSAIKDFAT